MLLAWRVAKPPQAVRVGCRLPPSPAWTVSSVVSTEAFVSHLAAPGQLICCRVRYTTEAGWSPEVCGMPLLDEP